MLKQLLAVRNMEGRSWWTGNDVVPRNISEYQQVSLKTKKLITNFYRDL